MEINIIHTNDVHSQLHNMAKISKYINDVKKNTKNCFAFDAGDIMTGSIHNQIYKGEMETKLLAEIDYDALALGNHEFDLSCEQLVSYMENSKHSFINSNICFDQKFQNASIEKYAVLEVDNVKIGITSVTTAALEARLKEEYGLEINKPHESLKQTVKLLKQKECDIVIAVNHIGYEEDCSALNQIPDIDFIISAHSHTKVNSGIDTRIVQTGSHAEAIGHVKLEIKGKKIIRTEYKLLDLKDMQDEDQRVKNIYNKYDKKVSEIGDVLLNTTATKLVGKREEISNKHTNLGALICDSFMYAAKTNNIRCDFAILNSRGIRVDIMPGPIYVKDIYQVVPFEKEIKVAKIKGSNLISAITTGNFVQCSNLYISYNEDVSELFFYRNNDQYKVASEEYYYFATNEYVLTGSSNYHDIVDHEVVYTLGSDIEVVSNYIKSLDNNFDYMYKNTILKGRE